jgi:flagellar protein FlaF
MGFSVSSAGAVIFISLFVTFGMVYSAVSNSTEQVNDAERLASDQFVDQRNTNLNVTQASYSSNTLVVEANNTGSTPLSLSETDLLVDNDHVAESEYDVLTVDGRTDTDLWLPGETLRVEVSFPSRPDRVLVASEHGLRDGAVI